MTQHSVGGRSVGPAQRVVVVRHGETTWSAAGRHTSRTDLPLTPDGRAAAEALHRALAPRTFARVFTSPLERARATCELVGLGPRAEVRRQLAEWDYGDYEGLTTAEIRRSAPGWSLWTDGAPGGETPDEVRERVDAFIRELCAVEGDVALFSHGHLSRALAARWIDLPVSAGQSLLFGTAAVGVLGWDRGAPVIERWNDDSHLRCPGSSAGGPG
ncbi:MAG: histidine phosphatase family protein [Acidimicrobiia bacterium]